LEQMAFTQAELESELLRQLAIQQMLDRDIAPTVSISQEELRSYYDENQDLFRTPGQVRARHILIRLDRDADSGTERQARQRIEQIRHRILDGEDFGELAKELSEDASGSEGGDLGFFSREQMVPEFAEAAFSLPPKEPSEPVRTDFGYHLIEVIDRKEAGVLAFAEVEPQLRGFLRHERMMESLDRLVVELRDVAEIEKYSERLSAENLAPGTVQE
jgi:peptidyl-prolyl cis-trans isomerase C